ncbi:MAG: ferredoxin [Terracoccus sp.]
MRSSAEPLRDAGPTASQLSVDRVACTGHGVCAQLLEQVRLDEWGYPIVDDPHVANGAADGAIKLCPARALYRR